jgi:hypothetical protein
MVARFGFATDDAGRLQSPRDRRLRVAVRQVDGDDRDAIDGGFDVSALLVLTISEQHVADQNRLPFPSEDGDAVPRPLALPDGVLPRLPDRIDGEVAVRTFQLLATDYVGRGGGKPLQQVRKAAIYVVDVEGSDPHGGPAHI